MRPNILMPIMIFMIRYYPRYILSGSFNSAFNDSFKVLYLTLFAVGTLFFTSCVEDPLTIGSDMLPKSDFVNISSTDTISVFSYTIYEDSVRSDNPSSSFLGATIDPYFGRTTADFVTQLRLGSEWEHKKFIIDSFKLNLRITDVKGVTGGIHYLRLSEIAEQIYLDSTYYSNRQVPLTGYVVSDIMLPELRADTINNIQVDVPVEFGRHLTNDTSMLFHDNSKPDFRSYFKGLNVSLISTGDPLFLTLSLVAPGYLGGETNYFTLYMHDEVGITKQYRFILDAISKNARFNRYFHIFDDADPDKKIPHINDGIKDTLSYLQGLYGASTKIFLPGLEKIKNDPSMSKIAVNKARLIIPVHYDGDLYKASTAPFSIRLKFKSTEGYKYDVPDYSIGYSASYAYSPFFDGTIDTTANVYNFNIPTFVQGYLQGNLGDIKPELEMFLGIGTKNVILKANDSNTPVKFELTYTRF